jgi:hypothetical protein
MTAPLFSYLRHLIVVAVLFAVEKTKLPLEGAEDAAHAIALIVIATITWAIVKYAPAIAKGAGLSVLLAALVLPGITSCATQDFDGSITYRNPETGIEGGIVLVDGKPAGRVTAPIYDADGNEIGRVDIGTKPKVTPTK